MLRPRLALVLLTATLLTGRVAIAQGKNLLFYGNSYSSRNGSVANLVQLIAAEAGHAPPTIVKRFQGSADLEYHETDPGQVQAIGNSLPAGQTWDHVVMQGQSTEATFSQGNPAQFRSSAVGIMNNVRAHSPAARGVMYQTWARALGHFYYPNTFATPIVMHDQIRSNYRLAVGDIENTFGQGAAVNSAVGNGVALLEWHPTYYEPDLFHPLPTMTLLASMCLYTSIYEQRVCDIDPSFGLPGPLVNWLLGLGLGQNDWHRLAGLADRCADPSLRPHSGSGDHLLLESGTPPGQVTACGHHPLAAGNFLVMQMKSLNGVYDNAAGLMLVNVFPTGTPPTPSAMWPELRIDTGNMLVLLSSTHLQSPLNLFVQMPFSFPGISVMVQGLAWAPSSETGNVAFTTTDAHVLDFQ